MICEPAALSVQEFTQADDLESLRDAWSKLGSATRGGSFYHTLDWLQVYWQHFGAGQRLRVLFITSGATPIGILPLCVTPEKTRLGTLHVLTYPLHDWGTFYGPIGPNPTATLTLAMDYLHSVDRDWDLLDLRWINRDEHDHLRTRWAMEHAGFGAHESVWKTVPMIDLDAGWQAYWMSRSAKLRQNMARGEQQLSRAGEVEHIRYRPAGEALGEGDPRWDLYEACLEVARGSWQGRSLTGTTLTHAAVEGYFRDSHERAAKLGMLDLNLLTVDRRPVAFFYNYICRGRIVGTRRGHVESFSRFGAGNVLFVRMLRDSFDRRDRHLDLGPGTMDSKRRWTTRLACSYRYTHYPTWAPRAQLLRLKHWVAGHGGTERDTWDKAVARPAP